MPHTLRFQIEIFKQTLLKHNFWAGNVLGTELDLALKGKSNSNWKDQFLAEDTAPKASFIARPIRGNPRPAKATFTFKTH